MVSDALIRWMEVDFAHRFHWDAITGRQFHSLDDDLKEYMRGHNLKDIERTRGLSEMFIARMRKRAKVTGDR